MPVAAADRLAPFAGVAAGRAGVRGALDAAALLLLLAEGHRHLEDVLAAVLALHAADVRVDVPVGAAGRFRVAPAGLAAVARRLAVLLVRADDALPAGQ